MDRITTDISNKEKFKGLQIKMLKNWFSLFELGIELLTLSFETNEIKSRKIA